MRGFTLLETIIYIAIIGVVLSGFVGYALNISSTREKAYVVEEVQANARAALDTITQKIRSANGVNFASSTLGSDPGVLVLEMNNSSLDPTIIDLSVNDGVLQIKEGAGSAIPLTSDEVQVTNLVFINQSNSAGRENIKVEITVEFNNIDGNQVYSFTKNLETSVSLRQ